VVCGSQFALLSYLSPAASKTGVVLALPAEKGKKHARGNLACVVEPLVGGYKGRIRGSTHQRDNMSAIDCHHSDNLFPRRASCPTASRRWRSHLRAVGSGKPTFDHQKAALPIHSAAAVLEDCEGHRSVPITARKHIAGIYTGL